jgi:hypothetical protein
MTLTFTAVQSNNGKTAATILLNIVKHISNIKLKYNANARKKACQFK